MKVKFQNIDDAKIFAKYLSDGDDLDFSVAIRPIILRDTDNKPVVDFILGYYSKEVVKEIVSEMKSFLNSKNIKNAKCL